eukprot:CAMPEP_0176032692 /NCGR_PEP_ID=MMETSP0120_2-20121206/16139_1 /TAXON_ID=160619 /ORGANISM="Kryptoperidinium foliaceum, Strain CCMP 1326" /LENGTH=277 /DNA_ID=CAMNT_0017366011 /DNA_START=59 /DNA_END=893 /DNA_ORIENTATION=+
MTTPSQKVTLTSEAFKIALDRYIDYNKPDPLARQQLESWSLQWSDDNLGTDAKSEGSEGDDFLSQPSHSLQGSLEIGGLYVVIRIQVVCMWKNDVDRDGKTTQHGQLQFASHASARFLTKTELKHPDKKTKDKIRAKMVKRLREDAYVSKLLEATAGSASASKSTDQRLLAEAKIQFTPSDLEERVTVSEDICEGIRRSVWSSAESPLDVIEVLLNLPFLPTTEHTASDKDSAVMTTTLANRAKLRLLEDAMCDACEKEGEDELLDDLKISEKKQKR